METRPGEGLTTWVEVSAPALRHNLGLFRGLLGERTGVLAVVKANAYGHGLGEVARVCVDEGVEMLGVHGADEVRSLRALGIRSRILVMGFVTAAQVAEVVDSDVHVLASVPDVLDALAAQARRLGVRLPVHLKVDTGTNRQGVPPSTRPSSRGGRATSASTSSVSRRTSRTSRTPPITAMRSISSRGSGPP
jgi:alanine racemase